MELYYFDKALRQLFLKYLIKVENEVKSLHGKLGIAQKGIQYVNGKNDLFSVVIALRYLLNDSWYKGFIKELKLLIDKYLKKQESISEQELYEKMGFPTNWREITRYKKS